MGAQRDDLKDGRGRPRQGGPRNEHGNGGRSTARGDARASSSLPFYKWFPGDYQRETRGWPLEARAIYRELLDAEWDIGPLPDDPELLREMVRATEEQWRTGWPVVAPCFLRHRGRRWHARLEELRANALASLKKRQASSQVAHAARWRRNRSGSDDVSE